MYSYALRVSIDQAKHYKESNEKCYLIALRIQRMRNDRSWMYIARRLPEFENGVIEFLNVSFSKGVHGSQIRCPCNRCINRYWLRRHEVYDHLKAFGFVENYYVWTFHGESPLSTKSIVETLDEEPNFNDNTNTLLDDRFRSCFEGPTNVRNGPNDEAKKIYKLVEEGQHELFPGCKNFSKLSFVIRLFLYKTVHGISNVTFNDLLQLLRDMVPEAKISVNFNEAKNIVRDLDLDYKKICACPKDCMLFWKEFENAEECVKCHASKWKKCEANSSNKTSNTKNNRQIPAKVLWHFPLEPRLQRVYMSSKLKL
ncbi:uncharacterized protein LOC141629156 [Silene latifolia]|uniref:uncharacterized protein LOC141629156 n=1 Tax=Silene latifolia TaxID=37657 RepID=UPI003D77F113